jgi:hypothetical protein
MHREKEEALKIFLEPVWQPARGVFTYYDFVKCVHDLMLQQDYMIKKHSLHFTCFDEDALMCNSENNFFLGKIRYLKAVVKEEIDSFHQSLAEWIVFKAGHRFKHTKLGYFIERTFLKNISLFI